MLFRSDLRRSHVRVVVGVEQLQGALVDLEALHRAAERDPQLLVELVESEDVGARVETHLVDAAGANATGSYEAIIRTAEPVAAEFKVLLTIE